MEKHITQIREKYVNSPPVTSVTHILTININYFVSHHRIKFPERNSYTFVPKPFGSFDQCHHLDNCAPIPQVTHVNPNLGARLLLYWLWSGCSSPSCRRLSGVRKSGRARREMKKQNNAAVLLHPKLATNHVHHPLCKQWLFVVSFFFLSFFLIDLNTGLFLPSSIYGWLILSGSDSLQICSRICVKRIPCIKR